MYILYTLYKMYTIAEFRQNLRKAFNDAEQGHEVVIQRHNQAFQLVALVDLPLGGSSFESTPKEIKPIKELTPVYTPIKPKDEKPKKIIKTVADAVEAIESVSDFKTCKNGHPLDGRGKCFGKGCKYAK